MSHVFDSLYTADRDAVVFGPHWCGPERFAGDKEWQLVARYAVSEDGDGQPVEVDCMAWPARFFRIRALAHEGRSAFTLSTGSGDGRLVHQIAREIARGMLVLEKRVW